MNKKEQRQIEREIFDCDYKINQLRPQLFKEQDFKKHAKLNAEIMTAVQRREKLQLKIEPKWTDLKTYGK